MELGWGSPEPDDRLQSGVGEFGRIYGKHRKVREINDSDKNE